MRPVTLFHLCPAAAFLLAALSPIRAAEPIAPASAQTRVANPDNYRQVATEVESVLKKDVLDKFFPATDDEQGAGFFENFSANWTPSQNNATRSIVYQSRLTWLAAQAALFDPAQANKYKALSSHGVSELANVQWDKTNGGFYWAVNVSGNPSNQQKHAYGNAFAIYAAAVNYSVTHEAASLDIAKKGFAWLENHSHDAKNGGYIEAMNVDGTAMSAGSPPVAAAGGGARGGVRGAAAPVNLGGPALPTIENLKSTLSLTDAQANTIAPLLDSISKAQANLAMSQAAVTQARTDGQTAIAAILTAAQKPLLASVFNPRAGGARGAGGGNANDAIGTPIGQKSMNSHIHILEGLTALLEVWPDPVVKQRVQEVYDLSLSKIYSDPGYLNMFFNADWSVVPQQRGGDSYGHNIEAAYLLTDTARVLGKPDDPTVWAAARKLVDHALEKGWDTANGGFYEEGNLNAPGYTKQNKCWWVEAEGLYALLLIHERYGKETTKYWDAFVQEWNFIAQHQLDKVNGGWYSYVTPDGSAPAGQALQFKTDQWTEGYHQGRALLNTAALLKKLVAAKQ